MDEQQYKDTYKDINPHRCVFEKAINSRVCNCSKSQRFNLADREGVACNSTAALERCMQFITLLREKARFTLQQVEASQKLPHAQEIRIQNGGLIGLQTHTSDQKTERIEDIHTLLLTAEKKCIKLDKLPYSRIMQTVSTYSIRKRRNKPD